jgi:hypothetical protein
MPEAKGEITMQSDIFKDPNYIRARQQNLDGAVRECLPLINRHGTVVHVIREINRQFLERMPDPKGKWTVVVYRNELIEDRIPQNAIIDRAETLPMGKVISYHY